MLCPQTSIARTTGNVRGSRTVGVRKTEFNLRRSHTDDLNGLGAAEGRNIACEYQDLTSVPGTRHTGTLIQVPKTIHQGRVWSREIIYLSSKAGFVDVRSPPRALVRSYYEHLSVPTNRPPSLSPPFYPLSFPLYPPGRSLTADPPTRRCDRPVHSHVPRHLLQMLFKAHEEVVVAR